MRVQKQSCTIQVYKDMREHEAHLAAEGDDGNDNDVNLIITDFKSGEENNHVDAADFD